jgi:catechol 2,3-dioxygenase-like lactoylglutathione lyase family enzyme
MFGRFLELGIATSDIAGAVQFYERLGFPQLITGDAWPHRYGVLGEDSLHQLRLRDPAGHAVTLLEARTYSPAPPGAHSQSLCGYFSHLSLPQGDYEAAREFWERAGFVALSEEQEPFPHLPLTSDHLDLAFHRRGVFDAPLLVFECADVTKTIARLHALEVPLSAQLPRGVDRKRSALIEAPEGSALLLLQAVD